MSLSPDIVLSVCMITYNHEHFISQAIEGVLMQEADFKIELVIGEDCSSDSTHSICEEYAFRHPELIKLLPSAKNLGMTPNFIRTLQACTGKYIALCEGDDYWTDPLKIQKQVDILEGDASLGGAFHDVYVLRSSGLHFENKVTKNYKHKKSFFTAEDVLINWIGHTCSFVFVRSAIDQICLDQIYLMDFSLAFLVALKGNLKHIPEIMGVYRDHPGGITKIRPNYRVKYENRREIYNKLNLISEGRYKDIINFHLLKIDFMYELACTNNFGASILIFKYYKLFTKYNFRGERRKNFGKYLAALFKSYYFG
ncbi:MAG: glycosyltransferase [Bacteroidales bacterium]|jgi:glycosyltransferase involved in cell wall biosynthesis|nr:glycosyltransferase [Bacteroidales bacterium]